MSKSSSSSGGNFNHDIGTKSGLTSLYNQHVASVEQVQRPMGSSSAFGIHHQGVKVTTDSGNQYLVHKGSGYGRSSETVVVDAKHMSNNWTSVNPTRGVSGHTVGDFVKTGGTSYGLVTDNCIHAANRMDKMGNK